ncbi:D-2-hydroxyacid dehydrogenase [Evansella sp. AB-P1]|uniref:D-2-hydroxyacid dehydrogenase n=1 Tax=Evansella sp. AB-P1 TaxID=3037653 RepID=UPI00241FBF84|nr:D-2-hydroxyacid dehydrogenase [Evansella sp. AB-P1]MDG5787046.1 D-2-hydroxyacid dehydrogenase [Evansella sp. AB-P1]
MKITKILFTGNIYKDVEEIMKREGYLQNKQLRFLAEEEVSEQDYQWADAYVSFRPTENFNFGNIKWVHSLGAGVDRFLQLPFWKEGIPLTRTICSFGKRISEYSLSYILKDLQYHNKFNQFQHNKEWNPITPLLLKEISIVIFGTGEIGQEVARVFSSFGVKVYGVSLSGRKKDHFEKVVFREELDGEFFQGINYVINTLPLTDNTVDMFNHEFFDQLSADGFINVGRGASVNNKDLIAALENGNIRSAVLDVFEEEPLPKDSPLWDHPNVTITPHISAVTTPEEAVECFLQTLNNIEENKKLTNVVDFKKGF